MAASNHMVHNINSIWYDTYHTSLLHTDHIRWFLFIDHMIWSISYDHIIQAISYCSYDMNHMLWLWLGDYMIWSISYGSYDMSHIIWSVNCLFNVLSVTRLVHITWYIWYDMLQWSSCISYAIISATFNSLEEFSSYATNSSDVVVWTDFERINTTHFWSPMKRIFIEPESRSDFQVLGNRKSFYSMQS